MRLGVLEFLKGASGAGQAGQALREIDSVVDGLRDKEIESFEVKLFLEEADTALDQYLTRRLQERREGRTKVSEPGDYRRRPVIDETFDVPWEVDELRKTLRDTVVPKITPGAKVTVEARVSESPAYRQKLAAEIRAELAKAGAADPRVDVLSAYKQGFLWMTERVIPSLKGRASAP